MKRFEFRLDQVLRLKQQRHKLAELRSARPKRRATPPLRRSQKSNNGWPWRIRNGLHVSDRRRP